MKNCEYNKEYKVRMDVVKCLRYKTFQPELPTKKFIFSDERKSIHNLKLLHEDSRDQDKATTIRLGTEKVVKDEKSRKNEEVEEKVEEEVEETGKAVTGMFRDNKRRIDLVLVVEDNGDVINNINIDFLSYILKAELEVEIEPGVMKSHDNLTFIKIHAPDSVLEKYGKFFGTKRYFADTRYDYMGQTKKYDKEWVGLVRKNYVSPYGYSNYERSIIVYKILMHLSFGDNSNYYGIERLLERKVIVDVFALHDGPYFLIPDQTISESNARQILNYYWSGIHNLFQSQPIHLIHEYFGPRLAFYFAFYEFFTKALLVAAFVGILNIILGKLNLIIYESDIKKDICESGKLICPEGQKATKARKCSDYCESAEYHLILDHFLIPLYSVVTVVGSFIFIRLWQRREYFLKWIWEVGRHDSYYKNAVRPLFDIGNGSRKDPYISGLKYSESIITIFIRNVISKLIIILHLYLIIPYMLRTYKLYQKYYILMEIQHLPKKSRDYKLLCMFQCLHTLSTIVFEKIYHYIIYFIVKCENHSTHKKFLNSILIKKISSKMILQYTLIAYYAWQHGNPARYKLNHFSRWYIFSMFFYVIKYVYNYKIDYVCDKHSFCFPFTCVIEVATLLATLLLVTQVIYKIFGYIFFLRTDYNRRKYRKSDIPCWEREYRLNSWTEEDMVQKYVNLAAQFMLVTWFVIAFPLAPLILFFINVWDIRHEARKLLLASRRPLLIKTPGTQMNKVFYFIASIAVLTNAMNIAASTRTAMRYLMHKLEKKPNQLLDFLLFYYDDFECYVQDLVTTSVSIVVLNDLRTPNIYRWERFRLSLYRMYAFLSILLVTGCLFLLSRYFFPLQQEVKKARASEEKIRNLYYYYEYEYGNDSKDR